MPDRTHDSTTSQDGRSVSPRLVLGVLLLVLALVFILQNTRTGRVHFLFWTVEAPAWTWLFLIFVVGVVVGRVAPYVRRKR